MPALTCPYCRVAFSHSQIAASGGIGVDPDGRWEFVSRNCPECGKFILHLLRKPTVVTAQVQGQPAAVSGGGPAEEMLVWPRTSSRPPCPPEVPAEYARYYNEAALILQDSPMASAALSRRCLQDIIENVAKIERRDLATEIQDLLDSKSLPSYLAGQIDGVRNIGNFAAHPIKSQSSGQVMDVEPGEADWNLDTLESLFDFYFVAPAKVQQRRAALDAKLAEVGKRLMKQ